MAHFDTQTTGHCGSGQLGTSLATTHCSDSRVYMLMNLYLLSFWICTISINFAVFTIGAAFAANWSVPFFFDNITANSVAYIPLSGINSNSHISALVSLDLGSNFFAVGIPDIEVLPSGGLSPLSPLPSVISSPPGSPFPFAVVQNSIVNATYGSGGFQARLASARFDINDTSSVVIHFGAMVNYMAPFPLGGPSNVIGILGLNYPYGPPYCVNGSVPSKTPLGRSCSPASAAVENVPLIQQLAAQGVIDSLTVQMAFQGDTPRMQRYGTLTLGCSFNPAYPIFALEPIYGIAFTKYFITRIPSMRVGDQTLPFSEQQLQGGQTFAGRWFGGWIVDSGWLYTVLPEPVFFSATFTLWTAYLNAGGTMSASKWAELVRIARVSGDDCTVGADYCAPLSQIPCVALTFDELKNLPLLTFELFNSSDGNPQFWSYPASNYMYPILPGCYQLGLTVGGSAIIGNLQMQGFTVFFDQASNIFQVYGNDGKNNNNNNNNSSNNPDYTKPEMSIVSIALLSLGGLVLIAISIACTRQRCQQSRGQGNMKHVSLDSLPEPNDYSPLRNA